MLLLTKPSLQTGISVKLCLKLFLFSKVNLFRAVSEALGQVKLRKKKEQASMHAKMSKMFA